MKLYAELKQEFEDLKNVGEEDPDVYWSLADEIYNQCGECGLYNQVATVASELSLSDDID